MTIADEDRSPSPLAGEGGLRRGWRKPGEGRARAHAKQMRSTMTDAESKLWQALRARRLEGLKFRRQVPVGPYIADFINFEHRLIVELDGSQHEGSRHDVRRDRWLRQEGFKVLRLWNVDLLKNLDGALLSILDAAGISPLPVRTAPSRPSPAGGEGCGGVR